MSKDGEKLLNRSIAALKSVFESCVTINSEATRYKPKEIMIHLIKDLGSMVTDNRIFSRNFAVYGRIHVVNGRVHAVYGRVHAGYGA